MGARPSSEVVDDDRFVDYYELLEVEQDDSMDVIRKSYRRLALRLHPDKNPGEEEEAKKKFVRLQEAYDVLMDEQERAWYDKNRERLVNGVDEDEGEEDVDAKCQYFKSGGEAPKATSMSAGIGVPHLLRFHAPSLAKDTSDSATSFFGTFRRLFERIAEEDCVASPYPGEEHTGDAAESWRDNVSMYPSFGHPDTPYVCANEADELACVRAFYQFWSSFSSRKCFAWKDVHETRQAKDRRIKRLLEKENKRSRDAARREYNEAIHGLVTFIRRRDPRVKAHHAQQQNKASNEADQMWRRAEAIKRQNEKRAQADAFEAQSWQMTSDPENDSEFVDDFSDGASLDEASGDESMWDCVACNKRFQSQAAWSNHERSKKHRKEVERLKREMLEEDEELIETMHDTDEMHDINAKTSDLTLDESANEFAPASRKKDKKRRKQQMKMEAAITPDSFAQPRHEGTGSAEENPNDHERQTMFQTMLPHLAELPVYKDRPAGSFDIFGYGSLIFKPPPHAISYTPGYIQGYVRRFAQHSEDHRGTPERPGRVVTLVSAELWHSLAQADEAPEGDIVWGISYTIDPAYAEEVRAYLDHREKNGYTPLWEPIYGYHDGNRDASEPHILIPEALVYVGLPDNPAFVGPQPLDELAQRIYTSEGPSGRNDEYLLRLADAVRILTPQSSDHHLFALEEKVRALQAKAADQNGPETKPKSRRKAKDKAQPPGTEVCNVCQATFSSRSKLFAHVREKNHALAAAPSTKRSGGKKK